MIPDSTDTILYDTVPSAPASASTAWYTPTTVPGPAEAEIVTGNKIVSASFIIDVLDVEFELAKVELSVEGLLLTLDVLELNVVWLELNSFPVVATLDQTGANSFLGMI